MFTPYMGCFSSGRRQWWSQRIPPPPIVLGYCSQLSIKLKIQDGARRALGEDSEIRYL